MKIPKAIFQRVKKNFYATKFRRISVRSFRSLSKKIEDLYHLFVEGRIFTENSTFVELTMKQIEEHFPQVELGGRWSPTNCYSRHHVNNFPLEICLFFNNRSMISGGDYHSLSRSF